MTRLSGEVCPCRLRTAETTRRSQKRISGLSVSAPASSTLSQVSPRVRESFYRDLVVSMRNGVLAIDRDGTLAVVNEVACRILGLGSDDQPLARRRTALSFDRGCRQQCRADRVTGLGRAPGHLEQDRRRRIGRNCWSGRRRRTTPVGRSPRGAALTLTCR